MSWNPYAFVEVSEMPTEVQLDFFEHVIFTNGINTRYLKPSSFELQEAAFGETFINFAGYKIQVVKEWVDLDPRIPEDQRPFRLRY